MILGRWQFKVLEHGDNLGRSRVGGTETIATTDNQRLALVVVECRLHVKIQRFSLCPRFFRAVENGDALDSGRKRLLQEVDGERAIEVNCNHTYLLSLLVEIVDCLAGRLCGGAHQDDNILCVFSSIVVEQVVFASGNLGNLAKVALHDFGNGVVVLVGSLTMCKESLGVFGGTACNRALRREGAVAETLHGIHVNQWTYVLHVHGLDFVILMRRAETVEEVDEGNAGLQCRKVRNGGKVHHLLYGTGAEHAEAGLAACHHILVVSKDTKRMRSQCTGRYVENAGQQFAGNLVHIGNHQQQTLRSSVGGCERTGLK